MKRSVVLVVLVVLVALVLGLAAFVSAQDKSKDKASQMTGTICDPKCVKQDAGKSVCDPACTEQSGEAVFIDDHGKAWKVSNPDICKGKMGKKVKVQCKKMDEDTLNLLKIYG